jgi:hypothetical protein
MTFDPEDDKVAAAFASLKAESSAQFPPPPVNELLGRAPAAKRRRRLVSLAAIAGACTAVTAGGFAVAQTIGPIAFGPEPSETENTSAEVSTSDESASYSLGDPVSPQSSGGEAPSEDVTIPAETTLVITDPGAMGEDCKAGSFGLLEDWTFADETSWTIAFDPEAGVGPVRGDVNGDGDEDVTAVLECKQDPSDIAYFAGVASFAWNEDGTSLEQLGWVWQPHSVEGTVAVVSVADGVVTVDAADVNSPEHTGEFKYVWDAAAEAFAKVEEDATTEPTPSESTSSPAPAETPTADQSAETTDTSGS